MPIEEGQKLIFGQDYAGLSIVADYYFEPKN
jgi:hypothetical protein